MTSRRYALGLSGLLAMGLAGTSCLNLPTLEPDTCGNRTLEDGEDCERLFEGDADTPECIAAGENNACRFSCALIDSDEGEQRYPCLPGWGCGADDICRRSSGRLGQRIPTGQPVGRWFALADMDGDGHIDIASVSDATAAVDYLEGGRYQESFRFPFEAEGLPSVSDADQDGRGDLLSQTESGLELLRGQPERELSRTIFTSQTIRVDASFEIITAELIPDVVEVAPGTFRTAPGDEVIIASNVSWGSASGNVRYGVPAGQDGLSISITDAVDGVVAAAYDETVDQHGRFTESPEQLAIPFEDRVVVLRPSYVFEDAEDIELAYFVEAPSEATSVPATHPSRTTVTPPSGFRIDRMTLVQANRQGPFAAGDSRWPCGGGAAAADEHIDLVVMQDATDNTPGRLAVAFGLGDGHFHGDPCALEAVANDPMVTADDRFSEPAVLDNCSGDVEDFLQSILAYDDIDGDGMPDVIGEVRIHLSGLVPEGAMAMLGQCNALSVLPHPENAFFRDVVTGDMDGDGIADVLASSVEPNLRIVTSNGGPQLRRSAVVTGAPVARLVAGDYDGDGLMDVAFSEDSSTSTVDLGIVFGDPGQVPGEAVLVGSVAELDRVHAGRFLFGSEADAASDLIVTTQLDDDQGFRFGLIQGRADRILGAPFIYAPLAANVGTRATTSYLPRGAVIAPFDDICVQDGIAQPALFLTGEGTVGAEPSQAMGAACIGVDGGLEVIDETASPLNVPAVGTAIVPIRDSDGRLVPVIAEFDPSPEQRRLVLYAVERDETTSAWTASPNTFRLDGATVAGAGAPSSINIAPTSPLRRWSPFLNNVAQPCDLWPDAPVGVAFLAIHDVAGECTGQTTVDTPAEFRVHVASSERFARDADLSDLREFTVEPSAPDEHIVGFACANLDGDPQQELAYLVVIGDVDQCDGSADEVFAAEVRWIDVAEDGTRSTRVAGRTTDVLTVAGLPPATGLGAGDFDRDGVEDIFLATPESGYVWLAEPSR